MNLVLLGRSLRDSWLLLVSCCAMALGFTWLRVWVASHIKVDAFIKFFSEGLQIFQGLLPVPIEDLASPLGRVAFSFEELGLLMLLGLWTVTRATDCLAGRIGAGTMEMLLAQPIRRLTLVSTHTAVTLLGVLAMGAASWFGVKLGLHFSKFDEAPPWSLPFRITSAATSGPSNRGSRVAPPHAGTRPSVVSGRPIFVAGSLDATR